MSPSTKRPRKEPSAPKPHDLKPGVAVRRAPLQCPVPEAPVVVEPSSASRALGERRKGCWIDGTERDAGHAGFPATCPTTGKVLTEVAEASDAEIDHAVFVARRALECGAWPGMTPSRRAQCLFRFASLLELRAGELARIEAQDTGRPVTQTLNHELPRAAAVVRQLARSGGATVHSSDAGRGVWSTVRPRPRGVVAVIVSWQSVLLDLASAWGSAWMTGCTVVTKPAPEASLLALRLAAVAAEAGVPDGVLNVLPGPAECGQKLVEHAGVDAVVFTGRPNTAMQARAAAAVSGKPVIADVGGLCPAVVLDDAETDRAADAIAAASFAFAGQLRRAVSRVLVSAAVAEPLLLRLGELADAYTVGNPAETGCRLGPMIDAARAEHARWITQRCLGHGGRRVGPAPREDDPPNARVAADALRDTGVHPVVIDSADRTCPAVCRPIVGPILTLTVHDTAADLAAAAQALTSEQLCPSVSVWTRDLGAGHRMADLLEADHVLLNAADPYDTDIDATPLQRSQRLSALLP